MKLSPPTTRFEGAARPEDPRWSEANAAAPAAEERRGWLRRPFLWLVVLPTLLVAVYFYAFAADQYVSEARFVVRGRADAPATGLLGTVLGQATGANATGEAVAVREYLTSHDAVRAVDERLRLTEVFRRPEADAWARLWHADPERLTRYFTSMATVTFDSTTGVSTLRVRSFRPEDSKAIAEAMLDLSEDVVNRLSARAREDSLRTARHEVEVAEQRVIAARETLTRFREREQSLDATQAAAAAAGSVAALEGALTQARAELQVGMGFMRADNPQVQNLRNRIAALERQIAQERARHTREGTLPQQLAEYERLMLEREFADRQLASATASLETARVEAQRQQLYLSRVVEPNLAVYPLYPRKLMSVGGIFLGLAVAYGIGWLLVAGMRDNAG